MKQVKSITTKSVYGNVSKKDIGKTLFYVTGIVDQYFVHQTQYGDNKGLKGDILAVNAQTGEKFASKAAFLPSQLTEQIIERLQQGEIEIEFKTSVELVESERNPQGYAFVCEAPQTEERKNKANRLLEVLDDMPLAIENKSKKGKAA